MKLNNILTSGYTFNENEFELKLKYILFNSLLLFNISLISVATIFRLQNLQFTQTIIDIIYVLFGLSTLLLARKYKIHFNKLIYFVVFFSLLIVTFSFLAGLNYLAGISWFIVLLMSTYFLTGHTESSIIFIISILTLITIFIMQHTLSLQEIVLGILPLFVAQFFLYFF